MNQEFSELSTVEPILEGDHTSQNVNDLRAEEQRQQRQQIASVPEPDPTPVDPAAEARKLFIEGLLAVANFYSVHPEVELPWDADWTSFNVFSQKRSQLVAAARALGHTEKIYQSDDFQLIKRFNSSVCLKLWGKRAEVCEAKVIGQEVVPEKVIPAQPERVEPGYTKDLVEWECKSLLAVDEEEADREVIASQPPAAPVIVQPDYSDDIPF